MTSPEFHNASNNCLKNIWRYVFTFIDWWKMSSLEGKQTFVFWGPNRSIIHRHVSVVNELDQANGIVLAGSLGVVNKYTARTTFIKCNSEIHSFVFKLRTRGIVKFDYWLFKKICLPLRSCESLWVFECVYARAHAHAFLYTCLWTKT